MRWNLLVVIGAIGLGLVLRWMIPPPEPSDVDISDDPETTSVAASAPSGPIDPLVPAIRIPGLTNLPDNQPALLFPSKLAVSEFDHSFRAHFHAHGSQVCASGCAASRHPTKKLTGETFAQLLDDFAQQPLSEQSPALENLCYFGRQARKRIEREGFGPLDRHRAEFLWKELGRTHARISIRVIDEHGEIRTWTPPTLVPLDRRHVFEMETKNLQPLETSGTVKRVGLYHLWTRL